MEGNKKNLKFFEISTLPPILNAPSKKERILFSTHFLFFYFLSTSISWLYKRKKMKIIEFFWVVAWSKGKKKKKENKNKNDFLLLICIEK